MQIAIALFPKVTILDALGPYQFFSAVPDAEVVVCAAQRGRLADAKGRLHIDVDHVFEDVPSPDVLLVPGGNITREMARQGDPVIDWVRSAHEHTTYTTSVCTGSLLLGAAGLLQGKKATTHWLAYDELRKYGAEPTEQRVVFQGKIVTGAGVSAGIDLALEVIARLSGAETAQSAQLLLEYDPQPPYDTGSPRKAPQSIRDMHSDLVGWWS
ncbi:DJ-1/PfpI family protein [Actinomadura madurae]|uniref:DJ-1/PfpI family protein n=1 Tax=Actinomadura madurae TaxID=1993 RepID=UPI0020266D76|nr:DJ-1/PfpI family protein [Actinomadura madurae]MCP9967806.1 DJ-1/PfpI family protein [Actinomadura madurae]MCP9980261.1 DJ-1/PfpI family protein [Actinomadura madurae]MCQ0008220.1 DJ-1/PfpI family protein [Actinomadura madurae]URM96570.1 DJ-1/PfpI family protein [Actinomadura madurae]URN07250.1 DJ-1/PfpI family protein [Actinomadura madurae]